MEITTDLIKHLANLSRLYFTSEEEEKFKGEFEQTLNQINELQSVDTTGVQTKSRVINAEHLREDEIKESLPNSLAVKNAPKQSRGAIVVPTVVE